MKLKTHVLGVFFSLGLVGCAAVLTDASDANQVTYINSNGESLEQLTSNANAYCTQYGKTASYRNSNTQFVVVFDCNMKR
jgi:hypothetical protein